MRDRERKSQERARELRQRMTDAEMILWSRLRQLGPVGLRFRRQHPIGPYVADFACVLQRVVIDVDGATHGSDAEVAYDKRREAYLKRRGWRLIRFWNREIYRELDRVMDVVCRFAADREVPLRRFAPPPP
jgi:very-short-patch-repair endonuclease